MATRTQHINAVLNVLRSELGLGESPANSNHNKITVWYNKCVDKIGDGAWCEMTNTWAMWLGGAEKLKKGRAYTVWAAEDGRKKVNGSSWHWGTKGMKAGDQVYYDWGGKKKNINLVDHTGTVEKVNGDGTFYVLEGNISNRLQRMHRDGKFVVGYVRFNWDALSGDSIPDSAPKPRAPQVPARLDVDGELGPKTISKWQKIMGTPIDGVISKDSDLVRAVQRKLKATVDHRLVVDGVGIKQDGRRYATVGALQRYLKSPVDGIISVPKSEAIKALQRRLNTGTF